MIWLKKVKVRHGQRLNEDGTQWTEWWIIPACELAGSPEDREQLIRSFIEEHVPWENINQPASKRGGEWYCHEVIRRTRSGTAVITQHGGCE